MEKFLTVKSDLIEIEKVRSFLDETLKDFDLSEEAYYLIELSLLEICINIVRYAYSEEKGNIAIKIKKKRSFSRLEIGEFRSIPGKLRNRTFRKWSNKARQVDWAYLYHVNS